MIEPGSSRNNFQQVDTNENGSDITQTIGNEIEEELQKSLELFDFTIPLQDKTKGSLRLLYNNCNSLEINLLLNDLLKRKRKKKQNRYIQEIENPNQIGQVDETTESMGYRPESAGRNVCWVGKYYSTESNKTGYTML